MYQIDLKYYLYHCAKIDFLLATIFCEPNEYLIFSYEYKLLLGRESLFKNSCNKKFKNSFIRKYFCVNSYL